MTEAPKVRKTRIRKSMADSDYKHKLSAEDKNWLENFEAEYYGRPSQKQLVVHPPEMGRELRADDAARKRDIAIRGSKSDKVDPDAALPWEDDPEVILLAKEAVSNRLKFIIKKSLQ